MVRRSSGNHYSPKGRGAQGRPGGGLKGFLFGAMLLLLVWDVAGPLGAWKYHRQCRRRDQLIAANIERAKENSALAKELRRLRSDRAYQERVVRRELGWIGEGELLYRFIPPRR